MKKLISNFIASFILIGFRNQKVVKQINNSSINELLGVIEILDRRLNFLEVKLEKEKFRSKKLSNRRSK